MVVVDGVYAGPVEAGADALRPIAELGQPLADLSGPVPYCVLQSAFDGITPNGLRYYWKSLFFDQLSDETIDAAVALAATCPSPQSLMVIRHLGGAIGRVPEEATAYGNRRAEFNVSLDSIWADAADSDQNVAWTRKTWAELEPLSNGGVYQNFSGFAEEGEQLAPAAHRTNFDRLMQVKRRYDPTGLFGAAPGHRDPR
jgi:hypothetical protein